MASWGRTLGEARYDFNVESTPWDARANILDLSRIFIPAELHWATADKNLTQSTRKVPAVSYVRQWGSTFHQSHVDLRNPVAVGAQFEFILVGKYLAYPKS